MDPAFEEEVRSASGCNLGIPTDGNWVPAEMPAAVKQVINWAYVVLSASPVKEGQYSTLDAGLGWTSRTSRTVYLRAD